MENLESDQEVNDSTHINNLVTKSSFLRLLQVQYGQFKNINPPTRHVFELLGETGVPGENPLSS